MGIVLGIDIGSSATKIVAMDESKTILNSLKVSASDPVTAMYGAVGKILCEERMQHNVLCQRYVSVVYGVERPPVDARPYHPKNSLMMPSVSSTARSRSSFTTMRSNLGANDSSNSARAMRCSITSGASVAA